MYPITNSQDWEYFEEWAYDHDLDPALEETRTEYDEWLAAREEEMAEARMERGEWGLAYLA